MKTIVILLSAILAISLLFASVEAVKSSGTKNQQFGKGSQIQVCGTHFCASDPLTSKMVDPAKNIATQDDLNALLKRMDKIHKQHQQQLSEKWQQMTNAEKIQFIQKMNQMMSKMESVDMASHMEMMLDDRHDPAHAKMKQKVHNSDKPGSDSGN